jgi:hypothetical protein
MKTVCINRTFLNLMGGLLVVAALAGCQSAYWSFPVTRHLAKHGLDFEPIFSPSGDTLSGSSSEEAEGAAILLLAAITSPIWAPVVTFAAILVFDVVLLPVTLGHDGIVYAFCPPRKRHKPKVFVHDESLDDPWTKQ